MDGDQVQERQESSKKAGFVEGLSVSAVARPLAGRDSV